MGAGKHGAWGPSHRGWATEASTGLTGAGHAVLLVISTGYGAVLTWGTVTWSCPGGGGGEGLQAGTGLAAGHRAVRLKWVARVGTGLTWVGQLH